jgi:signal recognition particle subunit SEC65
MNHTEISNHYKILNISENSSTEEINSAFKKLAFKYHPDKNRGRIEWATNAMARINIAYSSIISYRFKNNEIIPDSKQTVKPKEPRKETQFRQKQYENSDVLIERFTKIRESVNDALYKFFQYNLYNLLRRESISNSRIYNDIVKMLKKNYHKTKSFIELTDDADLTEHFEIFSELLFNFYRAGECLNVIDSYANSSDVDAYRMYKSGDDALHSSQKEIFFDRHNRGFFKQEYAMTGLVRAERIFEKTLNSYPDSSWRIETSIKKDYNNSLIKYVNLFFSE